MQWFVCGPNGVKIRTAPWRMGIEDSIGVRIKHGTKYFLRAGSFGPSCAVARNKLAHIATLRTRKAIRAPRSEASTAMSGDTTPTFSGYVHSAPGPAAGRPRPRCPQGATSSGSWTPPNNPRLFLSRRFTQNGFDRTFADKIWTLDRGTMLSGAPPIDALALLPGNPDTDRSETHPSAGPDTLIIRWSLVRIQAGPLRKSPLFTLSRTGIAPRRSPVRARLAPSEKSLQIVTSVGVQPSRALRQASLNFPSA